MKKKIPNIARRMPIFVQHVEKRAEKETLSCPSVFMQILFLNASGRFVAYRAVLDCGWNILNKMNFNSRCIPLSRLNANLFFCTFTTTSPMGSTKDSKCGFGSDFGFGRDTAKLP